MLKYLLVIYEYLKITPRGYTLTNLIVSSVLIVGIFYFPDNIDIDSLATSLIKDSISILGVLIGFSLAIFTLLNTTSNKSIEETKEILIVNKLYGRPVSLYESLLISMVYVIVIESFLLVFNLLFNFFFSLDNVAGRIAFAFDSLVLIYIILVNISTTVNFYFVITKRAP